MPRTGWGGFAAVLLLAALTSNGTPLVAEGAAARPREAEMEQAETRAVILGASYAAGWDPGPLGGVRFINKGVSGEQSFEMLDRFERDVIAENPRAVILWGYINDIHRGDRTRIDETLARARSSFEAMVEKARAAGIQPILATEATIRGKAGWMERIAGVVGSLLGRESYQDWVNAHVSILNDWLRSYAAENDLPLLDLGPVLSDESGRRIERFATEDGSHISEEGYAALTDYARPHLARLLREP